MIGFKTTKRGVKRPSLFLFFSEAGRAMTELSLNIPYGTLKKKTRAVGDGHPVFVLPGFLTGDRSTAPLRRYLKKAGYQPIPWKQGRNFGSEEKLALLSIQLEEIYEEYGESVSIIGWSLGGVFARQIAKEKPHMVRQVITLGSPFRDVTAPTNVSWLYRIVTGGKTTREIRSDLLEDLPKPAPVPTTAVYSKEDGIVSWQVCMEKEETEWHQNVQVYGSHFGLGINAAVRRLVLDRLQYSKADWQRFESNGIMEEWLLYPSV